MVSAYLGSKKEKKLLGLGTSVQIESDPNELNNEWERFNDMTVRCRTMATLKFLNGTEFEKWAEVRKGEEKIVWTHGNSYFRQELICF